MSLNFTENFIVKSINELIKNVANCVSNINFGKIFIYKKIMEICQLDRKYLEKRLYIKDISANSIVDGRLTISIPISIVNEISEIVIISE